MADAELKARRAEVRALLKQNLKDTFTFELWPWAQVLTTIAYLILIIVGDPWTDKMILAYLMTISWVLFQMYAMYKTYKSEAV
jgi:hypothetical protein